MDSGSISGVQIVRLTTCCTIVRSHKYTSRPLPGCFVSVCPDCYTKAINTQVPSINSSSNHVSEKQSKFESRYSVRNLTLSGAGVNANNTLQTAMVEHHIAYYVYP